jgi:hypothetical protein
MRVDGRKRVVLDIQSVADDLVHSVDDLPHLVLPPAALEKVAVIECDQPRQENEREAENHEAVDEARTCLRGRLPLHLDFYGSPNPEQSSKSNKPVFQDLNRWHSDLRLVAGWQCAWLL